jgi:uncharacterized membrane protein
MAKNIKRETHPEVRLRNRILLGAVAALAIVNALAAYFDIHSTKCIVVCNVLGVAAIAVAIAVEFNRMIPRKRWRTLSFLMPSLGVAALFCGRVMDAEGAAGSRVAIAVGVLIIFYGVVCAFKWRRYSLERRDSLQQSRKKR